MSRPLFARDGAAIRVGVLHIKAQRWPWQPGFNWRGMTSNSAPLNAGGARFGGGWRYRLGVDVGGRTVMLYLVFGMLSFRVETERQKAALEARRAEDRAAINRILSLSRAGTAA